MVGGASTSGKAAFMSRKLGPPPPPCRRRKGDAGTRLGAGVGVEVSPDGSVLGGSHRRRVAGNLFRHERSRPVSGRVAAAPAPARVLWVLRAARGTVGMAARPSHHVNHSGSGSGRTSRPRTRACRSPSFGGTPPSLP